MALDKIIVTIVGLLGIGFTYWFFLMKKEREIVAGDSIDIVVDSGYSPSAIVLALGKTTHLNFIRKDPNSCLEEVVLGDFKIKKYLPLNQKVAIDITPKQTGEFDFACGMNMHHGKIIVK